ncbi:TetR/AcrR family transcriptional regulator [Streptomyces alfalfae]|uniref:TetR family transcriptional regulator n=1 Tax=Streptomyces alfalfae TaxID=1642299 RepID=A0ABN4VYP7_9ACTN|nr:TetR/AcrR family transcriptional regulator [Streptomyces alfalfae]AYA21573.1 TetR/AcrR family transcriptional regulator [Streptomyces fradiae]APY91360.1 TetR family transcriptional regulator [Streptomyces alfalfae]QUI35623.1 TetR/AcrR family transcriptional regulator [Streptomyces alfalfae]RXX35040.1 TetR/AcrR family transcriptional regulator [Streptomyces alfalfae]RZM91604.1 TetR/AcrR family transcriptional regulator [Streptomyces alfalfae]
MAESSRITARDGVRADARRNRERVLGAARAVFAEHGIDAPMATVARRAGVGVATLYRHFPTRDALVRGVFAQQMEACERALTEALATPDPWQGFQHLVESVCGLQREQRGFPAAFVAAFPESTSEHAQYRRQAERDFTTLVRRAQAAGALRADFRPSDLAVILLAHCGLVAALPDDDAASRRLVAYLLQSFRTDSANKPLPPPAALTLRSLPIATDSLPGQRPTRG